MKLFLILVLTFSLFSCDSNVKKDCLSPSLIQKLDSFKYELADSLLIEKKQITLVDLLIKETSKNKRIAVNLLEFDSVEIASLIDCYSNSNVSFCDSNDIIWQINNPYNKNEADLYFLINTDKELDYLKLFWLYFSIDKSFISNSIYMKNEKEVYLNGKLLDKISDIRELFIRSDSKIKDFDKRAVVSISGDKDSVSMDLVDKIENELREINALRINYSTK